MAALHAGGNTSLSSDGEAPPPTAVHRHQGGWGATSFIIATVFGLTLSGNGWSANLIVFLINEFNIKRMDAAQISNVVAGCISFFPVVGAVVADSLLGCFSVIWISSLISLLGLILLLLIVAVESLNPPACQPASNFCPTPSTTQYAVLYSAIALASIGLGGFRFTLATMGANQFQKIKHQSTFFNWYFFSFYGAGLIASTGIVYVEDNLGWRWGFGICIAANVLALALFITAAPYYFRDKPRGSPFTGLLCVAVASIRKRKALISSQPKDYYYGDDDHIHGADAHIPPTNWFRQLNRAALKTEGDILSNGFSIATPWKLCSVQQVEDLKSIIRILPLWSSSIFLGTPIGVQLSLTVLQALAADRRLGRRFQFPAGSVPVFSLASTAIGLALINHCFRPMWKKTAGKNPTPLQQIGIGHVLNIASMAVSALVESRRRSSAVSGHLMSVVWLVPQMVVVGIGEAFHFPGQVGLYYQEFPTCLKSLSTAMVAMLIGVAFYLSTAVVAFIRRITDWLPNDINKGRVDYVYWVMVVIGIINFAYFLVISWSYQYKNGEVVNKDQIVSGEEA
ncbi:hypothetical protein C2S51_000261 [Perilla frutescens var. frutescens]|nr:hypothetical protein C2S51_000261 [Perilla frutescens var. frutescens]